MSALNAAAPPVRPPDFRSDAFVQPRNPGRRKATPDVRRLAVEAVVTLLENGRSFTAAVHEVGQHCGWAANSVRRWCYAAGVTTRSGHGAEAVHARDLEALAALNRRLVDELARRERLV